MRSGWLPLIVAGAALALVGCASSSGYETVDWGLPLALETALPDDVAAGDILIKNQCYYYRLNGKIHPVPPSPMQREAGRDRYCLLAE